MNPPSPEDQADYLKQLIAAYKKHSPPFPGLLPGLFVKNSDGIFVPKNGKSDDMPDPFTTVKPGGKTEALFKGLNGLPMGSVVKIVNEGDPKPFDVKASKSIAKAMADELNAKLLKATSSKMYFGKKPELQSFAPSSFTGYYKSQAFKDEANAKLAAAFYKGPMRAPRYVKPALTPELQAIGDRAVSDLLRQGIKSGMVF